MKYCLYGIGKNANSFFQYYGLYSGHDIVGVFDTNSEKWGVKISNYSIENPEKIVEIDFDKIIICPTKCEEIINLLLEKYHVSYSKIQRLSEYYHSIIRRLRMKYKDNTEINNIIDGFGNAKLNIYGSYKKENPDRYYVFRDDDGYPYVMLEGKRMYYPREYKEITKDCNGNEYMGDVLYEQGAGSPHVYVKDDVFLRKIKDGVIVDAGVCEGNFALRYIEDAKKVYLIEPETVWINALEKTFRPWRNKIVLSKKYLSRSTDRGHIALDDLVSEDIDFLKMDIEGYEIDALLGAKQTLKNSDCYCAICSYHRMNDEENIKFILENLGYQTSVSEGFMLFMHDPYFYDTLDFRRGIVYGSKI